MLSQRSNHTRASLQKSLPASEFAAVNAWLGTFYDYQLEWLLDWERFALLNKARQIGASHTYGAAAVLWGMFGDTTTIVSKGETESLEVLDKVGKHSIALGMLGSNWAAPRGRPTATKVFLRSGGRIIALPSTSGGRSFSGNVLLDEFAYHIHPKEVWDGAAGTVMHGYKLRGMSTPNGVGNLWHQLWTDPDAHKGYSLHEVPLEQAMADGLEVNLEDCWKMARGDPRVFDQLFHCKFLDNDSQYIPSELLTLATSDDVNVSPKLAGENYGGLDIGVERDLTALLIIRRVGSLRFPIHIETHRRTDDALIEQLVDKAFGPAYSCKRLCADATGIGSFPAQRLKRKHPLRFEPIDFTNKSKEELASGLYSTLSNQELKFPRHYRYNDIDEATLLREDICAIRRIVTTSGNVRYDAPRTSKGHADRAWALMLALHAADRAPISNVYSSARAHRSQMPKARS
jgi:phage FluMu gp28-like protein